MLIKACDPLAAPTRACTTRSWRSPPSPSRPRATGSCARDKGLRAMARAAMARAGDMRENHAFKFAFQRNSLERLNAPAELVHAVPGSERDAAAGRQRLPRRGGSQARAPRGRRSLPWAHCRHRRGRRVFVRTRGTFPHARLGRALSSWEKACAPGELMAGVNPRGVMPPRGVAGLEARTEGAVPVRGGTLPSGPADDVRCSSGCVEVPRRRRTWALCGLQAGMPAWLARSAPTLAHEPTAQPTHLHRRGGGANPLREATGVVEGLSAVQCGRIRDAVDAAQHDGHQRPGPAVHACSRERFRQPAKAGSL